MKAVTELLQLMETVLYTGSGVVRNNVNVKKDESVLFCFPRISVFAPERPVIK